MVRFDDPMAKLSIEGNPSNEVRTHFVGDRIRPGRARIGLTVSLPEGGLDHRHQRGALRLARREAGFASR